MLKYSVRIGKDNMQKKELVWREKYLSPDLSFISGVTSQEYHLEKYKTIEASNNLINRKNTLNLTTQNVEREGFIVIKGKPYQMFSDTFYDYDSHTDSEGGYKKVDYNYIIVNGKYYYSGETSECFTIDNWLVADIAGNVTEETINVFPDGDVVKIDTLVWIEDNTVTIDGYTYYYDTDEGNDDSGYLKYYLDGNILSYSSITECDGIRYNYYESSTMFDHVTKFIAEKDGDFIEKFENVTFCKYFFYINYKDHLLPITRVVDNVNDVYRFVCEIPKYVLSATSYGERYQYYETVEHQVYFKNETGEGEEYEPLDKAHAEAHNFKIYGIHDLTKLSPYVLVEDAWFPVKYDIQNANDGRMVAVYLKDPYNNARAGERVWFKEVANTSKEYLVYKTTEHDFNDEDTDFIVFGGTKYKVENNICDKVLINDNEHDIDYINGKVVGEDCLVMINGETVPMRIIQSGSDYKLRRYGKIVSGGSACAVTAEYEIIPYDGITIDGKKYIIEETEDGATAIVETDSLYPFYIREIYGTSMLVCEPDLNASDFTQEFYNEKSLDICREVVDKKTSMIFYFRNNLFGEKEITRELAFQTYLYPESSDEYYNLFDNLSLFVNAGYINVPVMFSESVDNGIVRDLLISDQYYESRKDEYINGIVDMEKDIYIPKYIEDGVYSGSNTTFNEIKEIEVNLHFRTRNIDSWKINEGYNLVNTSGTSDNWFITDLAPYQKLMDGNEEMLLKTSDVLGLLYFTNDDVFYQKKKLSKSFLRFSFYDSPDPNNQYLLASSCVFFDTHKAFKTYIDNSQKYISDFGILPTNDEPSGTTANKISVLTEYLGESNSRPSSRIIIHREATNAEKYAEFSGVTIDESHRISSRFTIKNKYESENSSEGFYLYIFREYSKNLEPKPIYMKVEFNHAGLGLTIPFVIPMKWDDAENDGSHYPTKPLTLKGGDIERLKEGIQLSYVNAQMYIPLYAVYDFKNKQYAYVFDNRYIPQAEQETGKISLNLFELKIKDESKERLDNSPSATTMIESITFHKQERGVINNNYSQFGERTQP